MDATPFSVSFVPIARPRSWGAVVSAIKATAATLGFGVTYSNPARYRSGGRGLPVDASWSYERVVRSTGGIVPDRHVMQARFRVYFGVF